MVQRAQVAKTLGSDTKWWWQTCRSECLCYLGSIHLKDSVASHCLALGGENIRAFQKKLASESETWHFCAKLNLYSWSVCSWAPSGTGAITLDTFSENWIPKYGTCYLFIAIYRSDPSVWNVGQLYTIKQMWNEQLFKHIMDNIVPTISSFLNAKCFNRNVVF